MTRPDDHRYMARAIQLAQRGLYTTDPNPRVGCVIVRYGKVIGEGWHQRAGEPHAEIIALRKAGKRAQGATVYVTLEPCAHQGRTPPCAQALVQAGVRRVVAAMVDPNPLVFNKGLDLLHSAGIEVQKGPLQAQAEALNPGFILRMTRKRPFVRCKLAMSLDGRTAMACGDSKWITGPDARRDVQRLRARSSAIVTGIGTVLTDDPSMTVREEDIGERLPKGKAWRQPLRVVVDPHLSTPVDAKILRAPGKTIIATRAEEEYLAELLVAKDAEVIRFPGSGDAVDLHALMEFLAEREVNEVLLETGATLSGAALRAGLIDELLVYMAPILMGSDARGLFRLPGMERMDERFELEVLDLRTVGRDLRITARLKGDA